jgi:hypothetical protein
MSGTAVALIESIEPLRAPEGWLELELPRFDADPFAARVPVADRVRMARAARAAGAGMATAAKRRGWKSAGEALVACGVALNEDEGDPRWGPFLHHAVYTAPPPRITLYRRCVDPLERLVEALDLRRALGSVTVKEVVLAHELCHHLLKAEGAPAAVRPSVVTFALGAWRRRAVVRAVEEIAAGGFAGAWCGVEWAPTVVDALTRMAADGCTGLLTGARPSHDRRGEG